MIFLPLGLLLDRRSFAAGSRPGFLVGLPAPDKKLLQDSAAGFAEQPLRIQHLMVLPQFKDIRDGSDSAGFRIGGTKINVPEPGLDDGAGAHDAGFERHIEVALVEAPRFAAPASLADGDHLGVQSDILQGLPAVVPPTDDLAIVDNHGADRHFAEQLRFVSLP